jgi:hypothetical protein
VHLGDGWALPWPVPAEQAATTTWLGGHPILRIRIADIPSRGIVGKRRTPEEDAPARGVRMVTGGQPLDLQVDTPARGVQVDAPTRGVGPGPDQGQSGPVDALDRRVEPEPGPDQEGPNQTDALARGADRSPEQEGMCRADAADLGPVAEPGPAQDRSLALDQGQAQEHARAAEGAPNRGADDLLHRRDRDHAADGAPARGASHHRAVRVPALGLKSRFVAPDHALHQ